MLLDASSYVDDGPGDHVFVHQICQEDGSGCTIPEGEGPLRSAGGRLRKDAIRPLGQCLIGDLRVPCPRKPVETIRAMAHSGLGLACLALPNAMGRGAEEGGDVDAARHDRRLSEGGLVAEDVRILQERSMRLDALGFASMLEEFDDPACGEKVRRDATKAQLPWQLLGP